MWEELAIEKASSSGSRRSTRIRMSKYLLNVNSSGQQVGGDEDPGGP